MRYPVTSVAIMGGFLVLSLVAPAQVANKGPITSIALSKTLAHFDVVSVRKNTTGDESFGIHFQQDGLVATNVPVKLLIQVAYDIRPDLILGLDGRVDNIRFDVTAKLTPPADATSPKFSVPQLSSMLIPLLSDRFHLQARIIRRTMPVYDLVVAKGGLKLKLFDTPDIGWNLVSGENSNLVLSCEGAGMQDLAAILSGQVHRKVVNKTGLTEITDFTLKWSDEVTMEQDEANDFSIFTALQEQLGLKLVPSKGPVDTVVIDHIEMPTQN